MVSISVVIINYFTEELLIQCLDTLFKFHDPKTVEIIIVNNGGELERLKKQFALAPVKIFESGNNVGFSKGNNIGYEHALGDYVLFLNSDVIFHEPVLNDCVNYLKGNSKAGVVGCRLLNVDGSIQLSYHMGHQLFKKLLLRNPLVIKFGRLLRSSESKLSNLLTKHENSHSAPWIAGAFMLFRKADILEYGWKWDEDFFMYWEDVELCRRIRAKRKAVMYYHERSVIHIKGAGADVSVDRFKMIEDSKLVFIRKQGLFRYWVYKVLINLELRFELFLFNRKRTSRGPMNPNFANEIRYYGIH